VAVKSMGAGRRIREHYPHDTEGGGDFYFRVLSARERARLRDLETGRVESTGSIRIDQGSFVHETVSLGLCGWDEGAVVFGDDHPDVVANKVAAGRAVKFRGRGNGADPRDLDHLDENVMAWMAGRILEINTLTSAEGKVPSSAPELPSMVPSSIAPPAPSDTATRPENSGDQDEAPTPLPA